MRGPNRTSSPARASAWATPTCSAATTTRPRSSSPTRSSSTRATRRRAGGWNRSAGCAPNSRAQATAQAARARPWPAAGEGAGRRRAGGRREADPAAGAELRDCVRCPSSPNTQVCLAERVRRPPGRLPIQLRAPAAPPSPSSRRRSCPSCSRAWPARRWCSRSPAGAASARCRSPSTSPRRRPSATRSSSRSSAARRPRSASACCAPAASLLLELVLAAARAAGLRAGAPPRTAGRRPATRPSSCALNRRPAAAPATYASAFGAAALAMGACLAAEVIRLTYPAHTRNPDRVLRRFEDDTQASRGTGDLCSRCAAGPWRLPRSRPPAAGPDAGAYVIESVAVHAAPETGALRGTMSVTHTPPGQGRGLGAALHRQRGRAGDEGQRRRLVRHLAGA